MLFQHMALSKLAIIGDIHSNSLALKACLQSIAEYESNVSSIDLIVFIGDLLTYGVQPLETLCEIRHLSSSRPCVFILGNHDQMYIDLIRNSHSHYYSRMPDWIKESVDFNLQNIDSNLFLYIKFIPLYCFNDTVFAHANFSSLAPNSFDWSYVNTDDDHLQQMCNISNSGFRLGVLGHTHRSRCFSLNSSGSSSSPLCLNRPLQLDTKLDFLGYSCSLLNSGSIGQPRERPLSDPAWLLIEFDDLIASSATFVSFCYDIDVHINNIYDSNLSLHCVQKLTSFFNYSR